MNKFSYIGTLKRFNDLGRSTRKELWLFFFVTWIIYAILSVVDVVLGLGFLGQLFGLVTIYPWIAVSIRRLHDTGRSGWWLLSAIVFPVLVVLYLLDSEPGANKYGPNPKEVTASV